MLHCNRGFWWRCIGRVNFWAYLLFTITIERRTGRGRSWIAGPAGISRLGPNSEPRGNNRSLPETRERARAPVKKIRSRDSIFGLVNSTSFFKITNHNQHAFNIKYLANLIKKYWTCFRCQKLADFLVCFPRAGPAAAILENLLQDQT